MSRQNNETTRGEMGTATRQHEQPVNRISEQKRDFFDWFRPRVKQQDDSYPTTTRAVEADLDTSVSQILYNTEHDISLAN